MLEVLDPGGLTLVEDLGRPGWAHLGISRSGAADRGALRLANRLLGNDEGAAALELTLRGPRLRVLESCVAVLTGATIDARLDGRELAMHTAVTLPAGAELRLGAVRRGLRTYLGVAGGIDAPVVFGSRATDTLSGLGGEPLRRGARVAALPGAAEPPPAVDAVPVPEPAAEVGARLLLGPRDDWIEPAGLEALGEATYVVQPDSDRVGVRLDGPPLPWRRLGAELRSEGVVAGAVQVPPAGRPIVLLADHPTMGGYPVAGVVPEADLDRIAQLRPGGRLRFVTVPNA